MADEKQSELLLIFSERKVPEWTIATWASKSDEPIVHSTSSYVGLRVQSRSYDLFTKLNPSQARKLAEDLVLLAEICEEHDERPWDIKEKEKLEADNQ